MLCCLHIPAFVKNFYTFGSLFFSTIFAKCSIHNDINQNYEQIHFFRDLIHRAHFSKLHFLTNQQRNSP